MKITFLGTGEAYSENRANVSVLVEGETSGLLDCGYLVPPVFWRSFKDKNFLDWIFINHWHADHFMGLIMLCMRWRQEKREKQLIVIGPHGTKKRFEDLFELLYPGFLERTYKQFSISFVDSAAEKSFEHGGYKFSFAEGNHLEDEMKVPAIAVRIEAEGKSFCYSGDTVFSEKISNLAKGCSTLVHESYLPSSSPYHASMAAHCSPLEAGRAAKLSGVKKLYLVHIHRDWVEKKPELIEEAKKEFGGEVFIPDDLDSFEL